MDSAPTSSFGYAPGAKKHDAGTLRKPSMTYCKYGYKEEIVGDKLSFPHKVSCKRANALLVLPTTQKIPEHVPVGHHSLTTSRACSDKLRACFEVFQTPNYVVSSRLLKLDITSRIWSRTGVLVRVLCTSLIKRRC